MSKRSPATQYALTLQEIYAARAKSGAPYGVAYGEPTSAASYLRQLIRVGVAAYQLPSKRGILVIARLDLGLLEVTIRGETVHVELPKRFSAGLKLALAEE